MDRKHKDEIQEKGDKMERFFEKDSSYYQRISSAPFSARNAFTWEKGREPKKPR